MGESRCGGGQLRSRGTRRHPFIGAGRHGKRLARVGLGSAKKPAAGQELEGVTPQSPSSQPASQPKAQPATANPDATPRAPSAAPAAREAESAAAKPPGRRVPPAAARPAPVRAPAGKGQQPPAPELPVGMPGGMEVEDAADDQKLPWLDHARRFVLFRAIPSWLISMMFHAALLMILAVVTLPETVAENRILAVANPTDVEEVENLDNVQIDPMDVTVFENQCRPMRWLRR